MNNTFFWDFLRTNISLSLCFCVQLLLEWGQLLETSTFSKIYSPSHHHPNISFECYSMPTLGLKCFIFIIIIFLVKSQTLESRFIYFNIIKQNVLLSKRASVSLVASVHRYNGFTHQIVWQCLQPPNPQSSQAHPLISTTGKKHQFHHQFRLYKVNSQFRKLILLSVLTFGKCLLYITKWKILTVNII